MSQIIFDISSIMKKYKRYNKSLLIGPDTTRPDVKSKRSIKYLTEFLENAGNVIDVISWHQYYFNGRTADAHDFLDPEIFNILAWQISKICKIKTDMNLTEKPLWLAETSSAWGGGSPLFSDRFIAGFIWLDKLGLSAKMGIDIVIRQSIFNGYYALIGDDYNPNPDYWISILYKKLVGQEVIPCYNVASKNIRLYCHCTNNIQKQSFPSVTVFGMNMQDVSAKIRIEGLSPIGPTGITPLKILSYTLTSKVSLLNKNIYLNGEILKLRGDNELPNFVPKVVDGKPYVIMPPYSIVFWVIPTKNKICYNLD
ncbi:hypothetical protein HHI36_010755 [Cryptolaemus montrouzieri]|uniref:Heparanase n=1 Tax=Cryptolaemus montrouzieri TaxID=559131 RepID=A0ABD2MKE7_9CUCU